MRSHLGVVLALVFAVAAGEAAEITLHGITYPDSKTVKLGFTATEAAPDATVTAATRFRGGQASVEVKWSKLEPAVLFGGDITTYVLWAVTPAGETEALGTVAMDETRGKAVFSSANKEFAMMITAEPLPTVRRPSNLVCFISGPPQTKRIPSSSFAFSGMATREGLSVERPSIKGMAYSGEDPPVLIAARKGMELVDRFDAERFAPEAVARAKGQLASATNSFAGGSRSAGYDFARRSIEGSSQALAGYLKDVEEQAEAARIAREQATETALGNSEEARQQLEIERRKLEADRAKLAEERDSLVIDRDRLAADRAALQAERDRLAAHLSAALAAVSSTEQTARGHVVSFGDINFDTGKADLKEGARLNLAKLSGILLMMPSLNLRVEGHTDSTGTDELNSKLSADRAAAVKTLLLSMGIDESRITSEGYGSASPIDTNDTREGRARNRRVEIILKEGVIAPR